MVTALPTALIFNHVQNICCDLPKQSPRWWVLATMAPMSDRLLQLNDRGPDVAEAQSLLNRDGAILDPDGVFGNDTVQAVRELQGVANLPNMPINGVIDTAVWQFLRGLPEPSADIPTRAVAFIGREEVGSRRLYDSHCARPAWPGGGSGVTIGVGYDLGYQTGLEEDWAGLLSPDQLSALRPWLGIRGSSAAAGLAQLAHVTVAWRGAWTAFIRRSLPEKIVATRQAFPGCDRLPKLCMGVLVSLVYNRGAALADPANLPGERQEMRDIRDAVAVGSLKDIPAALRSMKRLWPEGSGLRDRREREALLFEEGLQPVTGDRVNNSTM